MQTNREILEVQRAVRERDGYRCVKCGMSAFEHILLYGGRTLHVHRLIPGSEYVAEFCETLCKYCHAPSTRTNSDKATLKQRCKAAGLKPLRIKADPRGVKAAKTRAEKKRARGLAPFRRNHAETT